MDKAFYKLCIEKEVFDPYKNSKGKLNIIDRIWCKYISPESNSIYLVRKKQYYESRGGICRIYSRLIHAKLIRRYGIHITEGTNIDLGLRIAHPVGIVITKCSIGKNFQIYQNSTIGQKTRAGGAPTIGDNVIMYAGSSVIGSVTVCDNAIIAAGACLVKDAEEPGVYMGVPAYRKK